MAGKHETASAGVQHGAAGTASLPPSRLSFASRCISFPFQSPAPPNFLPTLAVAAVRRLSYHWHVAPATMSLAARTVLLVGDQAAVAALTCHMLGDYGGVQKHKFIIQLCPVWLYVKRESFDSGLLKNVQNKCAPMGHYMN